jgi:hypothetical protein
MGGGPGPSEQQISGQRLPSDAAMHIAVIALLVARAGQKDSLGWWDDESLTDAGRFALSKIFPRNPGRAALRLAFESAKGRHAGVLAAAGVTHATTLLDLAEPFVEDLSSTSNPWSTPIATPEDFRHELLACAPDAARVRVPSPDLTGLLDLTALAGHGAEKLVERAVTLAAGYLLGQTAKPVFPFIRAAGAPRVVK